MEPIQSRVKVGDIVETDYENAVGKKLMIIELDTVRDTSYMDKRPSDRNLWIVKSLDGSYKGRLSEGWFKIPIKPRKCHLPNWW